MAALKYERYVKPAPIVPNVFKEMPHPMLLQISEEIYPKEVLGGGGQFSMAWYYVTQPLLMVPDTEVHDFDSYFCVTGGDPSDINEFDAEIEMHLGEEREEYIITSPTCIYIPAGLVHCPLNFKRISKPIISMEFVLTQNPGWRPTPTELR